MITGDLRMHPVRGLQVMAVVLHDIATASGRWVS
jgi:hypothetical protein